MAVNTEIESKSKSYSKSFKEAELFDRIREAAYIQGAIDYKNELTTIVFNMPLPQNTGMRKHPYNLGYEDAIRDVINKLR